MASGGLSQSSVIAGALVLAFGVFVTLRGQLPCYLEVLGISTGAGGANCPSFAQQTSAPATSASFAGPGFSFGGGGIGIGINFPININPFGNDPFGGNFGGGSGLGGLFGGGGGFGIGSF